MLFKLILNEFERLQSTDSSLCCSSSFKDAFINSKLTEKEKFVVLHRFGFIDGEIHTLEEIGQMMGITRERVRQIENKSIRKLRKDSKIKKFA